VGKGDLKSSSSLPLHAQGRRTCTGSFKMAPCPAFFLEENEINLGITKK